MEVLGFQERRGNDFEPFSITTCFLLLLCFQCNQIYRGRAKPARRVGQRLVRPYIPKCAPRAAMMTQLRAAAAFPEACSSAGIQIGEKVFVGRAAMVVQ